MKETDVVVDLDKVTTELLVIFDRYKEDQNEGRVIEALVPLGLDKIVQGLGGKEIIEVGDAGAVLEGYGEEKSSEDVLTEEESKVELKSLPIKKLLQKLLFLAIENSHKALVEEIFNLGVDVNIVDEKGNTVLMHLAEKKYDEKVWEEDREILELFLAKGVDLNHYQLKLVGCCLD